MSEGWIGSGTTGVKSGLAALTDFTPGEHNNE